MKNETEKMRESMLNIEPLRVAILRQAVRDYITALRRRDAYNMAQLERFFLGEWGQLLSRYNGRYIIEHCKKIAQSKGEKK